MRHSTVTMSSSTIHNPAEPRHFMQLKPISGLVRLFVDETLVAESDSAVWLIEVGKDVYNPVVYVPQDDIVAQLAKNEHQTHCPLKGDASYYDLQGTTGEISHDKAVWAYEEPFEFAQDLKGYAAFRPDLVKLELEPRA